MVRALQDRLKEDVELFVLGDTLKRKRVLLFTSWKYYNTCEQIGNMLRENGFEHVIVARPELNQDNMWVQRNRNEMDEVDTVVIENTPKQTELSSSSSISKPIKTDQSSSSNTYNRDAFVQDENVDVFAMIGGDVSTSSSEEEKLL